MLTRLRRGLGGRGRRALFAAVIGLTLLSSVSTVVFLSGAKVAHAGSDIYDDVLFIHGFYDYCTNWDSARQYMRTTPNTWDGSLRTVGFYAWDGNCDVDFDGNDRQSRCDNYYGGAWGSVDQDLRNLSCQLAWYIYNRYTVYFSNVRVVAYSMGGLMIRYALDRVAAHDPAFPSQLYVPIVITMGTPHGGINDPAGAFYACTQIAQTDQNCLQGAEMQGLDDQYRLPNGSTSSQFLNTLRAETSPPSGSTSTEWTVIGSLCDEAITASSATDLPGGSGSHATHKIVYYHIPTDDGIDYPACTGRTDVVENAYRHIDAQLDYLHDMAGTQYQDATATSCDGCSGEPVVWAESGEYHSLAVMYLNLSITVARPPTPTPAPTFTPVPTCSVTNTTSDIERANDFDERGNEWHVYADVQRDATTNAPCKMRVVVRIFNPAPDGAWHGTFALMSYKGSNLASDFGRHSGSGTYAAHFVWRGSWFNVSSGTYSVKAIEYNGSSYNSLRVRGYITL